MQAQVQLLVQAELLWLLVDLQEEAVLVQQLLACWR